ncbi:hypothetical protein WG922_13580 [Ramlibacter sp. AN1015]|uniref:hypothetical protein n=1 Tax=Ramlibacter sp. AN1015 TaxID=3133428 RepID=UPI0030C1C26C
MNYALHKAGLMQAVLASDCPALGAFEYCVQHQLVGWREAEKQILRNTNVAIAYVRALKKRRWPALERLMSNNIKQTVMTKQHINAVITQVLYHDALGSFSSAK